jgi:hypothetical protein
MVGDLLRQTGIVPQRVCHARQADDYEYNDCYCALVHSLNPNASIKLPAQAG